MNWEWNLTFFFLLFLQTALLKFHDLWVCEFMEAKCKILFVKIWVFIVWAEIKSLFLYSQLFFFLHILLFNTCSVTPHTVCTYSYKQRWQFVVLVATLSLHHWIIVFYPNILVFTLKFPFTFSKQAFLNVVFTLPDILTVIEYRNETGFMSLKSRFAAKWMETSCRHQTLYYRVLWKMSVQESIHHL